MLPPSFFDHLQDRLNLAVFDINQEHRMGLREIKEALRGYPQRGEVYLDGNPKGDTVLVLPDREIEIDRRDTAQQIRAKLTEPPKMEWVMAPETAPAPLLQQKPEPSMSITGAANLAGTIKDRINAAKSKIAQVTQNTDSALAQLNDAADRGDRIAKQIEAEAADLNAELGQFTNE